jgi:hypothetical protein
MIRDVPVLLEREGSVVEPIALLQGPLLETFASPLHRIVRGVDGEHRHLVELKDVGAIEVITTGEVVKQLHSFSLLSTL